MGSVGGRLLPPLFTPLLPPRPSSHHPFYPCLHFSPGIPLLSPLSPFPLPPSPFPSFSLFPFSPSPPPFPTVQTSLCSPSLSPFIPTPLPLTSSLHLFFSHITDICVAKPDEKAVMTYVSFLHHAFPTMPPPHRKKVSLAKSFELSSSVFETGRAVYRSIDQSIYLSIYLSIYTSSHPSIDSSTYPHTHTHTHTRPLQSHWMSTNNCTKPRSSGSVTRPRWSRAEISPRMSKT